MRTQLETVAKKQDTKKSCRRDPKSSRMKFILKNTQGKINDRIRFFGLLFPQLPNIFLHTVKIISIFNLHLFNIRRGEFNELWCLT